MIRNGNHNHEEQGGGQGRFPVRRIVVTIDSSAHGRAAVVAAAALAHQLHAELEGVFVENIDLFHLAELPFGRVVDAATGTARAFDAAMLENQMRTEIARTRRMLEDAARHMRVSSSFRTARGRPVDEIIAAADRADLLIMGAAGHDIGVRFRPGPEALAAAERAPRSVLLLRSGAVIEGRPLVAYDGSEQGDKALEAAARMVRSRQGGVRVLIMAGGGDEDRTEALRGKALAILEPFGINVRFTELGQATPDGMCRAVERSDADLLVLAASDPSLGEGGFSRLLERLGCPVLLVR